MKKKEHTFAYEWARPYQSPLPTIVCLHGFTGTRHTFQSIADQLSTVNWLLIDCLGHGESPIAIKSEAYQFENVVTELAHFVQQLGLQTYHLLGYSMGARLALGWAMVYPERVQTLSLESGSPGLTTQIERQKRREKDACLAQKIEQEGVRSFVTDWEKLPLFASQSKLPTQVQLTVRHERLSQQATGLANSLRGMGTGSQPNYWPQLAQFTRPVAILVGALDTIFVAIGQQMHQLFPNSTLTVFSGVGHCIHLEAPQLFGAFFEQWLGQAKEKVE
jgi:2-succinyl-6-hydroxy-2,4-cyclohexadiene-1-carboxylate synthase